MWKNKKNVLPYKELTYLICKNLGQSFPHTRRFHWCVENSHLKCLQSKYVSSLYGSIFFMFKFFWTKFNSYRFAQNVGWVQRFFIPIVSWEGGKRRFKKLVLVTKWKNLCFSTSNIFFTLLPGQDWLGQKFMQQKKYLKITKFVGIYLKLTSRAIQNWYDFLSWFWKSPQKWQKKKGQLIFRKTF